METWRRAPGHWDAGYEVSDAGRVRSRTLRRPGRWGPTLYKGRVLKQHGTRYARVTLSYQGYGLTPTTVYVHDLVAGAFLGPKPEGKIVCHGNDDGWDNRLENLRYDTYSSNGRDAVASGAIPSLSPEEKRARANAYKRQWREERRRKGLRVT